jgi:hypothetical protein
MAIISTHKIIFYTFDMKHALGHFYQTLVEPFYDTIGLGAI